MLIIFSIYFALLLHYLKNKKRKNFNPDDGLEKAIDDFLKGKLNSDKQNCCIMIKKAPDKMADALNNQLNS